MKRSIIFGLMFAFAMAVMLTPSADALTQNTLNLTEGNATTIYNFTCTDPFQVDISPQQGSCVHYQVNCTPTIWSGWATGGGVGEDLSGYESYLNATEWFVYDNATAYGGSTMPYQNITINNGSGGDLAVAGRPHNASTINQSTFDSNYFSVNFTGLVHWNLSNTTEINITFCIPGYDITNNGITRTSGAPEYTTFNWSVFWAATDLNITHANMTFTPTSSQLTTWNGNYSGRNFAFGKQNVSSDGSVMEGGVNRNMVMTGDYDISLYDDLNVSEGADLTGSGTTYLTVNWTATQSSTGAPDGGLSAPGLVVTEAAPGLPLQMILIIIGVLMFVIVIILLITKPF